MQTYDGNTATPLQAAKRAYVRMGQQAEMDDAAALEAAEIDVATLKECRAFRRFLQVVDRRVRRMLRV